MKITKKVIAVMYSHQKMIIEGSRTLKQIGNLFPLFEKTYTLDIIFSCIQFFT